MLKCFKILTDLIILGIITSTYLTFYPIAFAQDFDSLGVANSTVIDDKSVKDGDIVSLSRSGYQLGKTVYDPMMVGVVTTNPGLSIGSEGEKNTYPVTSTGTVMVNVSSVNGDIKSGDAITTSATPGIGMKAIKSGYILGIAHGDFSSKNTKEVGKIPVSVNITYLFSTAPIKSSLSDIFKLSSLAAYEEPLKVLKYVTAAVIVIISLLLGLFSSGKVASLGIEALGRNPLAGRMIQFGILLNVLISLVIVAAGLGIAALIVIM